MNVAILAKKNTDRRTLISLVESLGHKCVPYEKEDQIKEHFAIIGTSKASWSMLFWIWRKKLTYVIMKDHEVRGKSWKVQKLYSLAEGDLSYPLNARDMNKALREMLVRRTSRFPKDKE